MKIVVDVQKKFDNNVSDSLFLVLADHLNFAIERARKGVYIKSNLLYSLEPNYPEEIEIGKKIISDINKKYALCFDSEEASIIALHIIESEKEMKTEEKVSGNFLGKVIETIEDSLGISIDRESFNYCRFAIHLQFLIYSLKQNTRITTPENEKLFEQIKNRELTVSECADRIGELIREQYGFEISDEEKLYLIIHINRLGNRK